MALMLTAPQAPSAAAAGIQPRRRNSAPPATINTASSHHATVRPTSRHLLASCVASCVKRVSLCCHRGTAAVREQSVRRKREEERKAPTLTLSRRCVRNDRYPPPPSSPQPPHGFMIPSVTHTHMGGGAALASVSLNQGGRSK